MLGVGRYLLGVAEVGLLAGFATLGANRVRARLLPGFEGAPAWLATAVVALAILIWVAELLGTFGAFKVVPYILCVVVGARPAGPVVGGRLATPYALLRAPGRFRGEGSGLALRSLRAWPSDPRRHPPE